jgi:hypothetical protein
MIILDKVITVSFIISMLSIVLGIAFYAVNFNWYIGAIVTAVVSGVVFMVLMIMDLISS